MQKINVMLYGGSTLWSKKESPLRAEIIYCDHCEDCPTYKEGKCYRITNGFNSVDCVYGSKQVITGYTSKARRYDAFKSNYKNDELFGKLHGVSSRNLIGDIGTHYLIDTIYVWVDPTTMTVHHPYDKGTNRNFIEKEKVTPEFIYNVCTFKPRALLGGQITKFQEEIVPEFLYQLSLVIPDLYTEVIKQHPELAELKPNHVGKYAKVKTLKVGCQVENCSNTFVFDGEKLICDNYKSAFLFNSKPAKVEVPVTDDMTIKITSVNQLCEDTEFVS